jgi:predicted DNA binding CopG/RHH family protein
MDVAGYASRWTPSAYEGMMPLSTQRDASEKKDTRLNVRVSEEMLERLHAAAQAEGIPLSSWVKRVLTLALREQEKQQQLRT